MPFFEIDQRKRGLLCDQAASTQLNVGTSGLAELVRLGVLTPVVIDGEKLFAKSSISAAKKFLRANYSVSRGKERSAQQRRARRLRKLLDVARP